MNGPSNSCAGGTNYGLRAADHVAWSKAMQEASVDAHERVITFHLFLDMDVALYARRLELVSFTHHRQFPGG
jgi:hypothetical protein